MITRRLTEKLQTHSEEFLYTLQPDASIVNTLPRLLYRSLCVCVSSKPREQVANMTPFCSQILSMHLQKTRTFSNTGTVQLSVRGNLQPLQNCDLIYKSYSNVAYWPVHVLIPIFFLDRERPRKLCYVPSASLNLELPRPLSVLHVTDIF